MTRKKEKQEKENKKETILEDKRGLSTVEYIIILVLIAASGIGLWSKFGEQMTIKITDANEAVGGIEISNSND